MGPLLRLAAWGITAAGALAFAVLAAQSGIGERRVAAATAPLVAQTEAARTATAQAMARATDAEREARRLGETVRTLVADRDKLAGRLAALETSLEDLTGSIALTQPSRRGPPGSDLFLVPPATPPASFKPPDPPTPPASKPQEATAAAPHDPGPDPRGLPPIEPRESLAPAPVPTTVATAIVPTVAVIEPPAPSVAGTVAGMNPSDIPLPRPNPLTGSPPAQPATLRAPPAPPAPAPDTAKRFAIEIGGPASIDNLRVLWTKVREGQNGDMIADLKPAIALRDAAKPGLVEMRLVAGPVPNALAAARLCASLAIGGVACRATPYEGQMLTLP